MQWECLSNSVEQTQQWGASLAPLLSAGDVVGLDGDLGAGKTHFVQGLVAAMGLRTEDVTSPTFSLIQEYPTPIPVCHLDAYRLRDVDEFLELGVDELLGGDCICLIEWASRVAEVLPQDRLSLQIEVLDESQRRLSWTARGPRSSELLKSLQRLHLD
ncbi:MAG: tRNA (adenosine(37)-N6)-threonylcarbamoyltransferase complex ATPase subunit type 1 TsaE [Planctomycetaceae bacterium]|nr:tRNA (adenosine(37)-N6)-threonylcarbamoyltransferase complex ATPase subunit type 1 TsaE [Planctomycetaceae bacterium]